MQGIGDSGQGFTNAILFILFTKNVRKAFLNFICCKCRAAREEETMSSGDGPNRSQVSVQTTSQNDDEDVDNDESKPFYVAALLGNTQPYYDPTVNQPV